MSGSASLTLEQGILQHTLGIAAMAFPAQVYVALCAAGLPPSESVGGVEAFGGGYSRVAATFALLASPTNVAANMASVEFPPATAAWGSLGYFEIWSAQTGGSRLYWGGLVDPVSGNAMTLNVSAGDIVRFSAGTLAIQAVPFTPTVSAGVSSFNTRTGAVILSNSDVVGVLPPSANPPLMDGTAAVGTSAAWARGDHVHPSDGAATHNIGRNRLHNALFNVAQRGTGPFSATGMTVDRWQLNLTTDANAVTRGTATDAVRASVGDEAIVFYLQDTFVGNSAAGAYSFVSQGIESVSRLSGKTVTVSFYAAASATLKLGINVMQNFGSGGSPSGPVWALPVGAAVTLTSSWARYSATIAIPSEAGKVFGTNNNDATVVALWLSSGATQGAFAGNIGVQSGTVQLWGVQCEVGTVATPLEKPDPRYDFSNCQRYYSTGTVFLAGYQVAGGQAAYFAPFSVWMRAAPAVALVSPTLTNLTSLTPAAAAVNGFIPNGIVTALGAFSFNSSYTASADL